MDSWDEIRTAFQVARAGTVSGAAEVLGVHHATVIRHIDALEGQLGVKLFQRHARGYTPTEAGSDLLQVAQATDDQFSQLAGRIKGQGQGVGGELVITSLSMLSPLMTPVLCGLRDAHPDLTIHYRTGERLFRLEYGEAHVAIRHGSIPDQPDNVVQHLKDMETDLVASPAYIDRYGLPENDDALEAHHFVGTTEDQGRAPFNRWLGELVSLERIRYRTDDAHAMADAIIGGAGIGFAGRWLAKEQGLKPVTAHRSRWITPTWLVTHVDLHRTVKVQTALNAIKAAAKGWD